MLAVGCARGPDRGQQCGRSWAHFIGGRPNKVGSLAPAPSCCIPATVTDATTSYNRQLMQLIGWHMVYISEHTGRNSSPSSAVAHRGADDGATFSWPVTAAVDDCTSAVAGPVALASCICCTQNYRPFYSACSWSQWLHDWGAGYGLPACCLLALILEQEPCHAGDCSGEIGRTWRAEHEKQQTARRSLHEQGPEYRRQEVARGAHLEAVGRVVATLGVKDDVCTFTDHGHRPCRRLIVAQQRAVDVDLCAVVNVKCP